VRVDMAGHEKLFCGNCKTEFEVAWTTIGDDDGVDEFGHPMIDTPCYCPFCGSPDIDDPSYFLSDEDE